MPRRPSRVLTGPRSRRRRAPAGCLYAVAHAATAALVVYVPLTVLYRLVSGGVW